MKFVSAWIVAWCTLSSVALGQAPEKRYLVSKIEAAPELQPAARVLQEALVLELGRRAGISVVTEAELRQTLDVAGKQAELGCDRTDACVDAVRRQLAVTEVISGQLGKLGPELVLTLRVVDTSSASIRARANAQAADLAGLRSGLAAAVDTLHGKQPERPPFELPVGESLQLAVMPLAARGVPESTASAMTQIMSAELNQLPGLTVLSADDIRAMLDKAALEAEVGCTDNLECIAEIGAALGLSTLVAGSVGQVGKTFVLSAQLIDTREAKVRNRVLESFEGDARELANATKCAAHALVGRAAEARVGRVELAIEPEQAELHFGARRVHVRNGLFEGEQLAPGRYNVRVLADARKYYPLQTDVYVAPGANTVRTFALQRKPTPWYRSWWFWSATSAAVVGATSATVVLTRDRSAPLGSGVANFE